MTAHSNAGNFVPRKLTPLDVSPLIPGHVDVPANGDVKLSPDTATRDHVIRRAPSVPPIAIPPVFPWQPPPQPPQDPSIWPTPHPIEVDPVESPPDSWPPLRTRNDEPTTPHHATIPQNLTVQVLQMKGVPEAEISAAINDPAQMRDLLNRLYGRGW